MDTEQLLAHLRSRQSFKPSAWLNQLEDRKREEIEFHNFERERYDNTVLEAQKRRDVHANRKYYSVNQSSTAWVDAWLEKHARDAVFLDYACGDGFRAVKAAQTGAKLVIGLDISDVAVRNARDAATAAGVDSNCWFIQGDCEATELPDDSIDTILCSGMLHHLDLDKAYPELHRILKPGGRLLGVEALGHNPVIQFYRNHTPHMRTECEAKHILKMGDVRRAEKYFLRGETKFWHLAALAAVPFRNTPLVRPALKLGNLVDGALMSIPGVRLMAWQITFELIKLRQSVPDALASEDRRMPTAPDDKQIERDRYDARARAYLLRDGAKIGPSGAAAVQPSLRSPYIEYEARIRRNLRPGMAALDVCCGTGLFSLVAAEAGASVTASDIAEHNLAVARRRAEEAGLTLSTIVADAEHLPFAEASFDLVTCAGSLSYVDLERFLSEVTRVLRPGGRFVCVDSLNHNPAYRFNRFIQYLRRRRTKSTLRRMPTLATLSALQSRFSSVATTFHGSGAFLIPVLRPFLGEDGTARWLDRCDRRWSWARRWAFKFVFEGTRLAS